LHIDVHEAWQQGKVIGVSESTVIRFIDELSGINTTFLNEIIRDIKDELKEIEDCESDNQLEMIFQLKSWLEDVLFIPYYLCVEADEVDTFVDICDSGFNLNGMHFKRFVGTPGGIKSSCVLFLAETINNEVDLFNLIQKRIDNGRNKTVPMVPAKLEAYKSLACSASVVVSGSDRILVVPDCVKTVKENCWYVWHEENSEPGIMEIPDAEVELMDSDGYGLIDPELAKKWSAELGYENIISGFCIRYPFTKGMLFTFDFRRFAHEIANCDTVTDAWGNEVNVDDIDIVLTESMLKLRSSYQSLEEFLYNTHKNNYSMSITKICEHDRTNFRELNYQFIQSYKMSDDDISELITPTMKDLCGVLGGDIDSTIIFLKGKRQSEKSILSYEDDFAKALMLNKDVQNDPYIRSKISQLVRKKIDNAKLGRVRVHGDYFIISGDPYCLCESIFLPESPRDGLLKAGEVYSRYWADLNVKEIMCFRAPMSCENNIRKVRVVSTPKMSDWYRYMGDALILNSCDLITAACNGADKDSDIFLTSDNPVLLRTHRYEPTVICEQGTAPKKIVEEKDLADSNVSGFGDAIGTITNRITAMFDVRSQYEEGSINYEELSKRTIMGEFYQQNFIDQIKGATAYPMPEYWYNAGKAKIIDDPKFSKKKTTDGRKKDEYRNIKYAKSWGVYGSEINQLDLVVNRKPYFMIYRYPKEKSEFSKFQRSVIDNYTIETGKTVTSIFEITDEAVMNKVKKFSPVSIGNCTMNRLCWKIETIADNQKDAWRQQTYDFDYSIYASGESSYKQYVRAVELTCDDYLSKLNKYMSESKRSHYSAEEINLHKESMFNEFYSNINTSVKNKKELCDAMLDATYGLGRGRQLVWECCGDQIIKNLLSKNVTGFTYYQPSDYGSVEFEGILYEKKEVVFHGKMDNERSSRSREVLE
jgi:hypothetical protein